MRTRQTFVLALAWALIVGFAVHFLDFPGSVPNFKASSGGGILLDASPAFTPDAIYQRIAAYGEQGRKNYSFRNVTVDVLLPLSVLPFLFLLNVRAVTSFSRSRFLRALLLALPFAYVIFDFVENAAVLGLLASYPERMDLLARSLPAATMIKRMALLSALAMPLAILGFQSVRKKFQRVNVS